MKPIVTLTLISCVFFSCQKEVQNLSYLQRVRTALIDSLPSNELASLDFDRVVLSEIDSLNLYLLRVPFKGKKLANDFVLLQTNSQGELKKGKNIHLERKAQTGSTEPGNWEGAISVSSLNRQSSWTSPIDHGYITAYHANAPDLRTSVLLNEMPEIIVVAYANNNLSYSEWIALQSLLYDPLGGGGTYYSDLSGTTGGGSYGGVPTTTVYQVDADTYANHAAIDLAKYLECFNKIPDDGSICSIEIFADIPVDSDPNQIFNFNTGSPGHCFIQIKKSNGSLSSIQNIGFYPLLGWKVSLTNDPVDSKFVDDGLHEFNASFKMNLSPENFSKTLAQIVFLSDSKYDIDNFNCTDWSLSIFNKTRTNKLIIPLYDFSGNPSTSGTSTPEGLYNKLKQMKSLNVPESANISIGFSKGYVAYGSGPCY